MTIKKVLFSTIFLSTIIGSAKAQYLADSYNFSQADNGATARFKGLGNAQTALGGDISSISGNPAGLGFFNRSDAAVTMNYLHNNNSGKYYDKITDTKKGKFGLENAGVVFNFPAVGQNANRGWLNFNVGIAYNKTNDYRNDLNYEGNNTGSTIADAMTDIAYNNPNFDISKDYIGSKLIAPVPTIGTGARQDFFNVASDFNNYQANQIIERGDRSETAVSFGTNYSNKLYLGLSLGLSTFRYETVAQFTENGFTKTAQDIAKSYPTSNFTDPQNENYDYTDAVYDYASYYSQLTEGSGVDVKLGLIYKPDPTWNIGFTFKTPTWYTVRDNAVEDFAVSYRNDENTNTSFANFKSGVYEYSTDYNLRTPYRVAVGLTKFFGAGLLTADAEFVDYSATKFSMPGYASDATEVAMNESIKSTYKSVLNVKVGGEYLFSNTFSGRLGFNYNGNPYKEADYKNLAGTAGLGLKFANGAYVDLAVVHNAISYNHSPYSSELITVAPAAIKLQRTNAVLTIGTKF
ncbi:hypothetical protein J5U18_10625 [Sphingobacteriaceae bacterium WQ 2009]|uniref:Outer membrane protein transport protein (OMPP1/FadL/TodX) n=1 Tax=Rhinopithecimicrobium faecis TaxID=2820698 RepID=A0A8T4HF96_9SPHI|nr:hypothetical protein [Sphingobacteriaceae bacterium WQ 2009]